MSEINLGSDYVRANIMNVFIWRVFKKRPVPVSMSVSVWDKMKQRTTP